MAPSSRTTPWMSFLVMRESSINILHPTPPTKWCRREEEPDVDGCGKDHDGGVQVSLQLLGRSHQHRMSCIQLSLSPQRIEQDPYEILTGNKPNLKYFRVFGCKCWFSRKLFICLNLRLELMRAYLLVMLQTLMLTVSSISQRDLLRRRVTWSLMRIMALKWSKVVLVM